VEGIFEDVIIESVYIFEGGLEFRLDICDGVSEDGELLECPFGLCRRGQFGLGEQLLRPAGGMVHQYKKYFSSAIEIIYSAIIHWSKGRISRFGWKIIEEVAAFKYFN
jgi:hypothetical protein